MSEEDQTSTPAADDDKSNNDVISHLQREANQYKDRRHRFESIKLLTIAALVGLGGIKVIMQQAADEPLSPTSTLLFAPFIAAAFDAVIFAEDYKVHRVSTFLRQHMRSPRYGGASPLLKEWESWQATYQEASARYYGSALVSVTSALPAILAYLYHGPRPTYDLLLAAWAAAAISLIAFVFSHFKSKYNEMVESPENLWCPVGDWFAHRKWDRFHNQMEEYFGERLYHAIERLLPPKNDPLVFVVPITSVPGKITSKINVVRLRENFKQGKYYEGRLPVEVRINGGYVALYEQRSPWGNFAITKLAPFDKEEHIHSTDKEGHFIISKLNKSDKNQIEVHEVHIAACRGDDDRTIRSPDMERPWFVPYSIFCEALPSKQRTNKTLNYIKESRKDALLFFSIILSFFGLLGLILFIFFSVVLPDSMRSASYSMALIIFVVMLLIGMATIVLILLVINKKTNTGTRSSATLPANSGNIPATSPGNSGNIPESLGYLRKWYVDRHWWESQIYVPSFFALCGFAVFLMLFAFSASPKRPVSGQDSEITVNSTFELRLTRQRPTHDETRNAP